MSLISQLLPLSNVAVDVDASSKKRVFELAGQIFDEHQQIAQNEVFDSLFARERLGSTGLGHGVAIPHGRLKGLAEAAGAFLRLAAPIAFDAPDAEDVSLVFVLLVPEQANETHLQLLAELAQLFSARSFRESILHAPDAEAIHQLFLSGANNQDRD